MTGNYFRTTMKPTNSDTKKAKRPTSPRTKEEVDGQKTSSLPPVVSHGWFDENEKFLFLKNFKTNAVCSLLHQGLLIFGFNDCFQLYTKADQSLLADPPYDAINLGWVLASTTPLPDPVPAHRNLHFQIFAWKTRIALCRQILPDDPRGLSPKLTTKSQILVWDISKPAEPKLCFQELQKVPFKPHPIPGFCSRSLLHHQNLIVVQWDNSKGKVFSIDLTSPKVEKTDFPLPQPKSFPACFFGDLAVFIEDQETKIVLWNFEKKEASLKWNIPPWIHNLGDLRAALLYKNTLVRFFSPYLSKNIFSDFQHVFCFFC